MRNSKCEFGICQPPQSTIHNPQFSVGVAGFEPATPCSQGRCASQTALHPETGSGGRIRTRDFLLNRQAPYQLSYARRNFEFRISLRIPRVLGPDSTGCLWGFNPALFLMSFPTERLRIAECGFRIAPLCATLHRLDESATFPILHFAFRISHPNFSVLVAEAESNRRFLLMTGALPLSYPATIWSPRQIRTRDCTPTAGAHRLSYAGSSKLVGRGRIELPLFRLKGGYFLPTELVAPTIADRDLDCRFRVNPAAIPQSHNPQATIPNSSCPRRDSNSDHALIWCLQGIGLPLCR